MKKPVLVVATIAQIVAAISFVLVIRGVFALKSGDISSSAFWAIVLVTVLAQIASTTIKQKYPEEHIKIDQTLNTPETNYGWIALGVFIIVVILFILFAR